MGRCPQRPQIQIGKSHGKDLRRYVSLRAPDWTFDPDELRAAFNSRTKAVILCNPNNPTGKVFTREEMEFIASLCREFDALCFTDEIYEHIVYPRADREVEHISMAQLEGMKDRTLVVNSMSKTYAVTGWRVGWAIAAPALTGAIRKVHDFLTVGAAAPLQAAGVAAMSLPPSYYDHLADDYRERRDTLCAVLEEARFRFRVPDGAYYVLCDSSEVDLDGDDVAFARRLVTEIGVAAVPGSSFYADRSMGARQIRFAFPKRLETLRAAAERLARLA